jgi:hypothetical protein
LFFRPNWWMRSQTRISSFLLRHTKAAISALSAPAGARPSLSTAGIPPQRFPARRVHPSSRTWPSACGWSSVSRGPASLLNEMFSVPRPRRSGAYLDPPRRVLGGHADETRLPSGPGGQTILSYADALVSPTERMIHTRRLVQGYGQDARAAPPPGSRPGRWRPGSRWPAPPPSSAPARSPTAGAKRSEAELALTGECSTHGGRSGQSRAP